ncbi:MULTISPECIES: DUF2989 domain-containing protein [unclassified Colwellia]|jgi:hypothetical protein|uniref:DUF2989 domain-containing protein n=1 Tax=unclassified Colwellia TaxID=196834 RepID=UPI0015F59573|nr:MULTISPECIES: DUF2989 domain-containing protein [unclassified Colwellia]MBA6251755.1 DUF2989 domain-containing protein [Colwellia sp. MB3u-55]MBA6398285.1 DUF2989 domain-containing protein [Colwellia sp. BRX10-4]
MKTIIAYFSLIFLLTACDSKPNFAELCESNSEICNEFQEDSWCKRERITVGFSNLEEKLASSDLHKYHQLIAYEDYAQCMVHASKIEHIKLKHKQTMRVDNAIQAQNRIKEISKETITSDHPHLLYYHWSRYINEESLNKFLAQEGTKALENSRSQYNLATHYTKKDPKKTLTLLYRALQLYQPDQKINAEIFQSIATIFIEKQDVKKAYLWLRILRLHSPENKEVTEKSLNNYVVGYKLNKTLLDKIANITLDKIEAGTFESPKV